VERPQTPIIGESPSIRKALSVIRKAAKTDLPVLLVGETGTGKELFARELHEQSIRSKAPFVPVNTGAIPRDLVSSELFGHIKGAFTGAASDKEGRFAEAHNGTLFLDEISTMTEEVQVTLLRVLEAGRYRPVGAKHERTCDVRIVAATNEELYEPVKRSEFRQDLLHRLEVLSLTIPPLRERGEDIPQLAQYFLKEMVEQFDVSVRGMHPETMAVLESYSWPGNIRELKNVIAQACVMAEAGEIEPGHLPPRLTGGTGAPVPAKPAASERLKDSDGEPNADTVDLGTVPMLNLPADMTLAELEQFYTEKVLELCDHNKTKAAERLGISRKALYDKLARWEDQAQT